jgi:hypothetical protein
MINTAQIPTVAPVDIPLLPVLLAEEVELKSVMVVVVGAAEEGAVEESAAVLFPGSTGTAMSVLVGVTEMKSVVLGVVVVVVVVVLVVVVVVGAQNSSRFPSKTRSSLGS